MSGISSPLCVLRVLCGSIQGDVGGTTEAAEDTEDLRVMSVAPRLARRDQELVPCGGGGAPLLPMPANPRRGACRGCRHPSASSVSSVVQSRVTWGGTTEAAEDTEDTEDTEDLRVIPSLPRRVAPRRLTGRPPLRDLAPQNAVVATRTALAMSVNVRFLAGSRGRTAPSTTCRLGKSQLRQDRSTASGVGSRVIGNVPA